ncbi:MAG: hypothetical protein EBZ47_04770 [Chlamydiae bacterium]|nr:hypothetical protein [Chlamydiota bacterium]
MAKRLPKEHFFCMTRLDQNRATAFLAAEAGVPVSDLANVTIWGNHSSTQVPDFVHAKIKGISAASVLPRLWLEGEFFEKVQKRGAEVIAARGKSSAASAASAAIDAMKSLIFPSKPGDWFSMGCYSKGNSYGVDPDLFFSFPCSSKGGGNIAMVSNLEIDSFIRKKIEQTENELKEERSMINDLLS